MRKYYLDNIRWSVIVLVLVFHVVSIYCSCGAVMSYMRRVYQPWMPSVI